MILCGPEPVRTSQSLETRLFNNSFPNDVNGDVLRRMLASGDDLSVARDIDFAVVFPSEKAAQAFAANSQLAAYKRTVERSQCAPGLPYDVIVVRNMLPTHAGITEFEEFLEQLARPLGGRNDGWGCMAQVPNH
jgi:hypothetical protein